MVPSDAFWAMMIGTWKHSPQLLLLPAVDGLGQKGGGAVGRGRLDSVKVDDGGVSPAVRGLD